MNFFNRPFPTPDEYESVWLPKKLYRNNEEDHRRAKRAMKQLAARLRKGYLNVNVCDRYYLSENAREMIEKQLRDLGWSPKTSYDTVAVERPLAEVRR